MDVLSGIKFSASTGRAPKRLTADSMTRTDFRHYRKGFSLAVIVLDTFFAEPAGFFKE